MLKHNLPEIKRLLHNDWKKSGKKWNVFIKDYEAHHIVPVSLLEESEGLQYFLNNGGKFSFNSIENGIFVKKVAKGGQHANHPKYSEIVAKRVQRIYENSIGQHGQLHIELQIMEKKLNKLTKELKSEISNGSINNQIKINDLF